MTRRVALPSEPEIRAALVELAGLDGHPTVVAVARAVGLANATFWRHFPQIAQEVAEARRTAHRSIRAAGIPPADSGADNSKEEIARLRRDNSHLRAQLELAAAHIQHLTFENKEQREKLEAAAKVRPMQRR